MVIRALSFDADQTLWDFSQVYAKALDATVAAMVERGDIVKGRVTADKLKTVRDEVLQEFQGRPHSLEEVREKSFAVFLERAGHQSPTQAASELVVLYMDVRFTSIELYPEVSDALVRLKPRFKLGLLSNGNTYPDRCGLPGVFDAQLFGPDLGFEKPDVRAFAAIARQLHVDITEVMHIGDSSDDVQGAKAAGAISVFIARPGTDPAVGADADYTVDDLTALEHLLGTLR